jgi:hypothetical protein
MMSGAEKPKDFRGRRAVETDWHNVIELEHVPGSAGFPGFSVLKPARAAIPDGLFASCSRLAASFCAEVIGHSSAFWTEGSIVQRPVDSEKIWIFSDIGVFRPCFA